ncbi:MAG: hypothetical protein AMS18_09520, partial [Gemmatimonas sp. SG8_17]
MYQGRHSLAPGQRGVLLLNLGMPGRTDASSVRKFLWEFLNDPLVMGSSTEPRWIQRGLRSWLLHFRAARLANSYRPHSVDSGSQPNIIAGQAAVLAAALPEHWRVFTAVRYGEPSIATVLKQMQAEG